MSEVIIDYRFCRNPHCRETLRCAGLWAVEHETGWRGDFLGLYREHNCQELDQVTLMYNLRNPSLPGPDRGEKE